MERLGIRLWLAHRTEIRISTWVIPSCVRCHIDYAISWQKMRQYMGFFLGLHRPWWLLRSSHVLLMTLSADCYMYERLWCEAFSPMNLLVRCVPRGLNWLKHIFPSAFCKTTSCKQIHIDWITSVAVFQVSSFQLYCRSIKSDTWNQL